MDPEKMKENAKHAEGFLKMFANQNRLLILCSLVEKELSVSELNQAVPLAQSALSQHLAALRKACLVNTRRDAQTIYYSIADDRVKRILDTLYALFCDDKA